MHTNVHISVSENSLIVLFMFFKMFKAEILETYLWEENPKHMLNNSNIFVFKTKMSV